MNTFISHYVIVTISVLLERLIVYKVQIKQKRHTTRIRSGFSSQLSSTIFSPSLDPPVGMNSVVKFPVPLNLGRFFVDNVEIVDI